MPKISVIIPVYNAEKYLNKTLESILKQSLKDIEVICVDDGSTDGSVEIIQSFIKKDDRVKLIRQNNQHAGSARNTGLKEAQGEYIHFMDADDYVLNYAYEAIYNKVIKYDLDCLKFSSVVYDVKQKDTVDLPAFTLTRLRPGDFNRLLTLEEGSPIYKVNVAPWNGVYRRTFLEKNNIVFNLYGPDERTGNKADVENLVKEANVSEVVKVFSEVYDDKKREALLKADFFVHTSRYEGMPMSVLEALAYGLPCLLSKGTNMTEDINSYNAGWDAGSSVSEVVSALKKVITGINSLESLSKNALSLSDKYKWESIAEKTQSIYEKLGRVKK